MSAVQEDIKGQVCLGVLKPPFNTWPVEKVLTYYQARTSVRYFAVVNEGQVAKEKIDALLDNCFEFNAECYQLVQLDWLKNPSPDIEWAIMLHKFYYAVGLGLAFQETCDHRYVQKWLDLTDSWIDSVPLDFLPSDVAGRRIQNWVFAHYYFINGDKKAAITGEFYRRFLTSIHQQVTYLCQHLTPTRNHRTLELYSIFLVAVVFPELQDAGKWLDFAIMELTSNSLSDILPDGVHCELSTDYHHIVLRNFLAVKRLAVLNDITLPEELDSQIQKALVFSLHVHRPDGIIPSLSDGDTGSFLDLLQQGYEFYGCPQLLYGATQGQQGIAPDECFKAFSHGGYYIMRSSWGIANQLRPKSPPGEEGWEEDNKMSDLNSPYPRILLQKEHETYEDARYLVFDCGDLGAGNHGHLDLLSFEMAAYGQPLIVDPGRYTYDESGENNWRVLFRGTAYHNTVVVDGKNQTRYQFHTSKFKIKGPQPDYELKAFTQVPGLGYVHGSACSHEYPVVHERKILFINGEYWLVCDLLQASEEHSYDLLFHLAANAQGQTVLSSNVHNHCVIAPHLMMLQLSQPAINSCLETGFISPSYGVKQAAPIAKFSQYGASCCFYTVLYPYKNQVPHVAITSQPVFVGRHACSFQQAVCLDITINQGSGCYSDQIFVANEPASYFTEEGKSLFGLASVQRQKQCQGEFTTILQTSITGTA